MKRLIFVLVTFLICSCNTLNSESVLYPNSLGFVGSSPLVNDFGKTILERFDAPLGYNRVNVAPNSFGYFLRTLDLKPEGTLVRYYNGQTKPNHNNIYVSVVDLPAIKKNLKTSADSGIRLISEYLFQKGDYDKIAFHIDKQRISFVDFAKGNHSREKFDEYLDFILEKISTPSFCSDLQSIDLKDIKIGDVFVQNHQPNGHAVIVVDLVENNRGEKLFMLAQSFHPAQDIQIISNPNQEEISPWYQLKEGELLTPEWRFMSSDLMRFKFLSE